MTIDPADFRKVLGHFPTGVMVVTGATDEGPAGMAIGSFASVSLEPPLETYGPRGHIPQNACAKGKKPLGRTHQAIK